MIKFKIGETLPKEYLKHLQEPDNVYCKAITGEPITLFSVMDNITAA